MNLVFYCAVMELKHKRVLLSETTLLLHDVFHIDFTVDVDVSLELNRHHSIWQKHHYFCSSNYRLFLPVCLLTSRHLHLLLERRLLTAEKHPETNTSWAAVLF